MKMSMPSTPFDSSGLRRIGSGRRSIGYATDSAPIALSYCSSGLNVMT